MSRVWLVTKREIVTQARSKGFQIGTGLMILIALVGGALPGILSKGDADRDDAFKVAAVGELAGSLTGLEALDEGKAFKVVDVADPAAADKAVRDGTVDAAVVPADAKTSPLGFEVVAKDKQPAELVGALSAEPPVRLLEPPKVPEFVRYLAAFGFAVVFFMISIMYGQMAAQNTVVEKQTRVIEILLATVPARVLLAGKILSNAVLAFATVVAMAVALVAGLMLGGTWKTLADGASALNEASGGDLLGMLTGSLAWFLVFFLVAFVLFSSLMVGSAATVSRLEEVSSVLTPTMLLVMIPYFLILGFQDNNTVVTWLSYIPFSSPTAMPLRVITGVAAWWEPLVALAILVATSWLAILLGGRLYENSILRTGARIKFKDAFATQA
ncbi:MAG: ABC transporter permease [Bifidobacteriaceae bacterium]|jgi:ABC-2 type transport system permease protein|nr:ABC transporter permease [Bifidobacteriaceae bacterium]